MTTKRNDLQLILLAAAAAREDGSLLPPPTSVAGQLARIRKAIPLLLKQALVAEVEVGNAAQAWRVDGERQLGAIITDAGRSAIGAATPEAVEQDSAPPATATAGPAEAPAPARPTKTAQVLALLGRADGATLAELVAATGWLPLTTRAALTGLRKKGHAIAKRKRDDVTCYHRGEAA